MDDKTEKDFFRRESFFLVDRAGLIGVRPPTALHLTHAILQLSQVICQMHDRVLKTSDLLDRPSLINARVSCIRVLNLGSLQVIKKLLHKNL